MGSLSQVNSVNSVERRSIIAGDITRDCVAVTQWNLQAASVTLSLATHYAQTESKVRNYIANFAVQTATGIIHT